MRSLDLKGMLKGKSLVEQAVWYRMLSMYDTRRGWGRNEEKFDEYLLTKDEALISYPEKFRGWRELDRELTSLRDAIVKDEIVSSLYSYHYLSEVSAEELVEWAQCLGAILAVKLKTNQIRRFLGAIVEAEVEVKKGAPEDFSKEQAEYLKVYLAYATGRNREVLPLLMVVDPMITLVRPQGQEGREDFNQLVRFVRAVVAYHKFYGGDE